VIQFHRCTRDIAHRQLRVRVGQPGVIYHYGRLGTRMLNDFYRPSRSRDSGLDS
jgi:hypothetical protein